jgi:hypothetical protein
MKKCTITIYCKTLKRPFSRRNPTHFLILLILLFFSCTSKNTSQLNSASITNSSKTTSTHLTGGIFDQAERDFRQNLVNTQTPPSQPQLIDSTPQTQATDSATQDVRSNQPPFYTFVPLASATIVPLPTLSYSASVNTSFDNSSSPNFPPIANQPSASCVDYSLTYYLATFALCQVKQCCFKPNSANPSCNPSAAQQTLSPEWTYALSNGGNPNNGSSPGTVVTILSKIGAPFMSTYANDYGQPGFNNQQASDQAKYPDTNPLTWRAALNNRFILNSNSDIGFFILSDISTPESFNQLRTGLANHNTYSVSIMSCALQNTTNDSQMFMLAPYSMNSSCLTQTSSGASGPQNQVVSTYDHEVTIVGYDDTIPFAVSKNGTTTSYNGALKVANSWGTTWSNQGFFYIPYFTIFNPNSLIAPSNANPLNQTAFFMDNGYYATFSQPPAPTLLAYVTFIEENRGTLSWEFFFNEATNNKNLNTLIPPFPLSTKTQADRGGSTVSMISPTASSNHITLVYDISSVIQSVSAGTIHLQPSIVSGTILNFCVSKGNTPNAQQTCTQSPLPGSSDFGINYPF